MEMYNKFMETLIPRQETKATSQILNRFGRYIRRLLELLLEIDERIMLIPCHAWTPHFGIYGSASGYDSLQEAFGDLEKYVYGIETGLSSDPEMNWLMPELHNRSILSFSDAHSPAKMGREATVFQLENITYESVRQAIMQPMQNVISTPRKDNNRILYTIEFYPEEGKYHYSGHRNCRVVQTPEEIGVSGNICPVCHRRLTEGVLYRVQQLSKAKHIEIAERAKNEKGLKWYHDPNHYYPPYLKLVPLNEIVSEAIGIGVSSKKVKGLYTLLIDSLGSEIDILLQVPIVDIEKVGGARIAEAVQKVRAGDIVIEPGYDGIYGKVAIRLDVKDEDNG